jgi:uncharacterized membrane protein YeaQ/YmgE (transglycosylase-associated protein family)
MPGFAGSPDAWSALLKAVVDAGVPALVFFAMLVVKMDPTPDDFRLFARQASIGWLLVRGLGLQPAIAKFLMPGKLPCGILVTIALGMVGAVAGGFIGAQLGFGDFSALDPRSMLLAFGGGVLVLFIFGLVTKGRA